MSKWIGFFITITAVAGGGWVVLNGRTAGDQGGLSAQLPTGTPMAAGAAAPSRTARPNILIIMPDDVGYWNVGAYSHGMMVPTPNIDPARRVVGSGR
jgi:hypothetical protein